MRYDDWDVLLFPSGGDARVPLKEFKVSCHVVPDGEFSHNRGTLGLPVMTCFVPGLQPGAPFHISIHCWGNPKLSQYTQSYSKHPELVKLEARILVDGQVTKRGELEQLKFPTFRRELLYQNHWNPGDDLGRIKIVISEGFPRDSPSNPFERVKNVIAFAFQHAPLVMTPTLNLHSFQKSSASSGSSFMDPSSEAAYQEWINSLGLNQQQPNLDAKVVWPNVISRSDSKQSSADASIPSMSGYLSSTMGHTMAPNSMHISGASLDDDAQMVHLKVPTNTPTAFPGGDPLTSGHLAYNILNSSISSELASSLTHTLLKQPHPLPVTSQSVQPNQIQLPASEVKSRKENRHFNNASSVHSPSSNPSPSIEAQIRKFSPTSNAFGAIVTDPADTSGSGPTISRLPSAGEFGRDMTNTATPNQTYAGVATSGAVPGSGSDKGIKRSRNFTPASAKVIDVEDEPRRASPRIRVATAFPLDVDLDIAQHHGSQE
ncbi:hypothetical protein SLS53_008990 [Cytospora paraplurivora]|uniref:Uncharacterized protein n=1 Tax=Cytospora paraplurivora TaxID=2898453 RepID=A0AAN9YBK4_9PEZI